MLATKGVNQEDTPQLLVPTGEDSDTSVSEMRPGEETLDCDWIGMETMPPTTYAWRGEIRGSPAVAAPTMASAEDQSDSDSDCPHISRSP
jgi:hypothetical protein